MSNPNLASRFAPFGTTIFTEMTLLALKHQAVNLAQGFPDFDGPEFIKQAAIDAINLHGAGANQYARMFGLPDLNNAVAHWFHRSSGVAVNPDTNITVTSGCTEAIAAALLGLVNPGDEVILFEPFYDSYRAAVAMAGGVVRCVTLRPAGGDLSAGFSFDDDRLRQAFTDKTRAVLINTPHNPTGKVFSQRELRLIADLCIRHNTVAIADEVYERLTYDDAPHVHLASLPGMFERTITLSSLGKTFSLTGWKIGWAIGPEPLTKAVRAAHQFLTFATATPLQSAAAKALTDERSTGEIASLRSLLKSNRDLLARAFTRLGVDFSLPQGAYFIIVDWKSASRASRPWGKAAAAVAEFEDDNAFCRALPELAGVAAIPPSAFYVNTHEGRSLARFAFCKKRDTMLQALERLSRWTGVDLIAP